MKVGKKVILATRDGFGSAISEAFDLQPNISSSSLPHKQTSCFELPLEKYGIEDQKASGEIINFLDSPGSIQVSILLLQNYEPPVAACAVKEVLESIIMDGHSSELPTLILPVVMSAHKIKKELRETKLADQKDAVYGFHIGQTTNFTQALITGTTAAPPSLRISCEVLACLIQMVRVLGLPTVLLIGSSNSTEEAIEEDLKAVYHLGEHLASHTGLCFSRDKIHLNVEKKSRGLQEPWRALYG